MLGDNIRQIRKDKKISINKLSEVCGISLGYLSDLENNKAKNPTMEKLETIASALKVPINQLLTTKEKLDVTIDSLTKINEMAKNALETKTYSSENNESSSAKETQMDYAKNNIGSILTQFHEVDFTDTEHEEISNFIKYVLSKRK